MRQLNLGFTLVELAIVLVVLTLVLGGLLMPLATQVDIVRIKKTNDALDQVQEALLGYAIANNNRLPCPDRDGDGFEDNPCPPVVSEGNLPWKTLGVGRHDAWGREFRYHPDENFVVAVGFPPDTAGKLLVQDRRETLLTPLTTCNDPTKNGPAAIVFSIGKNAKPDAENENINDCGGVQPSVHVYTEDTYLEGTYDDILIWMSKNVLINRLVAAGTWPP